MLAERLAAQQLTGPPATDPVAVAERLLAIQAQDPRGARLAVRARSTGLTANDVDAELTDTRSLVITWLNRGTLHLVRPEDYFWLQTLTTPALVTGNARRLAQEGVSPDAAERGVAEIERSLAEEGPMTRGQLRERLDAADVPTAGQALVHVLMLSAIRGLTVRGPMVGGDHAFVRVPDWLGSPPTIDHDVALAELARRYLAGHGPASDRDLARWAGLPLRDARAGLGAIGSELRSLPGGLVALARRELPAEPALPPPKLLGAFDPMLLGWTSRELLLGADEVVVTVNGLFRPFALVRGQAVATWGLSGGSVELKPFAPIAADDRAALESEREAVLRFLGTH